MAGNTQTFSESWHRVAKAKVSLRPSVTSRRLHFRGERWHVLEDPFSNQFFRLRPAAYDFIARLDGEKTIEDAWQESLALHPEEAPGQEEIVQLLAQLFQSNLIRSDLPPDITGLFQRYRKRRHKELRNRLQSILFCRFPLFDPDRFLARTLPMASWLFSWFGFVIWALVIGFAIKTVIDNGSEFANQSLSVLAPNNLPLLYVAMAFIKLLHELGHGYACRKFGGEVHILGIMLLVFTPVPYVDATSSWRFRSKWQRIIVSGAGMYVELLVAAIAVFVWAATGQGVIHSLAYNLIFIASVSTILFNLNPLIRFDGYYILSDLLGIPNLNQRSNRQWRHLLERWGFGVRRSISPSNTKAGAGFYMTWGAAAFLYRIVLFTSILLFVADRFLLLGIIIAITGIITWLIVPICRAVVYLGRGPRLERNRGRALLVTAGLVALVAIPVAGLPLPHSFSAPGILRSEHYTVVFAEAAGMVQSPIHPSGTRVEKGQVLLTMENPELLARQKQVEAQLQEAQARERLLLTDPGKGLSAIREQIVALESRQAEIERQRSSLQVKAPVSGIWISPQLESYHQAWLPKGGQLGEIVNPESMEFAAVVSQEDALYLFSESVDRAAVKLRGQTETVLPVEEPRITPGQQRILPSPALGWSGGGGLEVKTTDQSGREAAQSFYEFVAKVDLGALSRPAFHGQSGKLRCPLPPETLLDRGLRKIRQLTQRRFGL